MHPHLGRLDFRTASAGAAVLAFLFLSTGCGEAIQNSGEDDSFIREPGRDSGTASKATSNSGPLLPLKPGISWRNRVTVRRIGTDLTQTLGFETVVSSGQISLAREKSIGLRLQTKPENNTISRTETFQITKSGIFLASVEGEQVLTATPALPIVSYPIREGEIKQWKGVLRLSDKNYPCRGYSRVRSQEEITLLRGKVTAYRIDSMLIADVNGRKAYVPMTRWFAPGVGMVRYRYASGTTEVTKETVSYKI
jgi:hypothetical protein